MLYLKNTAQTCLIPSFSYLTSHNLYNASQSAYRPDRSTETALLIVVNYMFLFLHKGNIYILALLEFSVIVSYQQMNDV